jgi:hypothetical protein
MVVSVIVMCVKYGYRFLWYKLPCIATSALCTYICLIFLQEFFTHMYILWVFQSVLWLY